MYKASGRVVHCVPAISEEASGPSYSVVRLCESLTSCGQLLTLATLDWEPTQFTPSFSKMFPLDFGPRRLGRSPAMHRWLQEQARNDSIDLIHNHSLWMMPNVYPGWVARRSSLPLVVSPRGTLSEWAMKSGSAIKRIFWPLVQKPALSATACFHATAQAEYEDIRNAGFRQPVAIIPNGIDMPPDVPKHRAGKRTLLFLGRVHPTKGVNILLKAWQAVAASHPEWHLRVAGPDNDGYLPEMRSLAAALRLERVEFSGALYGDAKLTAYREAELFVLPTHSENFGMTVAEALAAGTPAIVSKGAPWSELENRGAGWWIDIGVNPLVACLRVALAQPHDVLRTMGARGRDWMQAEYSWRRVAQQMMQTYDWILTGRLEDMTPSWVRRD